MAEVGIVRRMDELGRIVIPKEIRRSLSRGVPGLPQAILSFSIPSLAPKLQTCLPLSSTPVRYPSPSSLQIPLVTPPFSLNVFLRMNPAIQYSLSLPGA